MLLFLGKHLEAWISGSQVSLATPELLFLPPCEPVGSNIPESLTGFWIQQTWGSTASSVTHRWFNFGQVMHVSGFISWSVVRMQSAPLLVVVTVTSVRGYVT